MYIANVYYVVQIMLPLSACFLNMCFVLTCAFLSQNKIALVWLKENSAHSHLTVEDTACKQLLGGHLQHTAVVGQIVTERHRAGPF
jgi:hypothetical protein